MIAEIVGRNSEAYCAASATIGAHIGAIRLTPIAPYTAARRQEASTC
jgi:hypothetical protein